MKMQRQALVDIGTEAVTIRLGSQTVLGRILGRVDLATGGQEIYLDRLLHEVGEDEIGGYRVSGAISTIIHVSPLEEVADS